MHTQFKTHAKTQFRWLSLISMALVAVLLMSASVPAASAAQATMAATMNSTMAATMSGTSMSSGTMASTVTAVTTGACGLPGVATPAANDLSTASTGDIKIGVAIALSGAAKAYGDSQRKGLLLALSEINGAGGVDGKKLALVIKDTTSDKSQAVTVFQGLINADKVAMILGPTLSTEATAADVEAQKASVPVMGMSNTGNGITSIGDYVFRDSLSEASAIPNTVKAMRDNLKVKSVAIMYAQNDKFSSDGYQIFKQELDKSGIAVLDTEVFDTADTDFSAQLTRIQGLSPQPDAIIVASLLGPAAKIIVKARQLGINTQIVGGNGFNTPLIISLTKASSEGTIFGGAYDCNNPDAVNQTFVKAYLAKYGDAPDQFAAQAYSALKIVADALHRAGSADPKALRDALAATKDLPTPLGAFSFDANRDAQQKTYVIKITGGKFTLIQ